MRPPHFLHFSRSKNFGADKSPNIGTAHKFRDEKYIYTSEKIQQGWKEKGAPFRSGGAKRQIQGYYSSGSKEKWGTFSQQKFTVSSSVLNLH